MPKNETNITCEVVSDLLAIYASGEASPETAAFVETHLNECPNCKEALEAAQLGENLLAELDSIEKPFKFDGRKILIRLNRIFFGISTLALLLIVVFIALVERMIVTGLFGISLPQFFVLGSEWNEIEWLIAGGVFVVLYGLLYVWRKLWANESANRSFVSIIGMILLFGLSLIVYKYAVQAALPAALIAGTFLFTLYLILLSWRAKQTGGRFYRDFLLSAESATPLLLLTLATLTLMSSDGVTIALVCGGLLIVAWLYTLVKLPELPYMTILTILILLVGGGMLIGNAVGGFANLFDFSFDQPSDLGHPVAGISKASRIDLTPLGFALDDHTAVTDVDGLPLPEGIKAYESSYTRRDGSNAYVTVIQFNEQDDSRDFFSTWRKEVSNGFYEFEVDYSNPDFDEPDIDTDSPLEWQIELPGIWFGQEGQLARSYDEDKLTAYSAWQVDDWVTIVEVRTGVNQALVLSRRIKESVADSYLP